jgi:hypothetical protein
VLFFITKGRSYYLAAAYPMLVAAGAVLMEQWLTSLPAARAHLVQGIMWSAFAVSGAVFATVALPITPVNSRWWNVVDEINGTLWICKTITSDFRSEPEGGWAQG